jgi:hypothetical protein
MDRKELTEENIELGKKVLKGLDKEGFHAVAAFWLLAQGTEGWRYVIASEWIDKYGPIDTYGKLQDQLIAILGKENIFIKYTSLISPTHPLINLLKVAIQTDPRSVSGIRFTGNVINGQYIDDAYIYRMS